MSFFFKIPNSDRKLRTVYRHRMQTAYRCISGMFVPEVHINRKNATMYSRSAVASEDYVYRSTFMEISR